MMRYLCSIVCFVFIAMQITLRVEYLNAQELALAPYFYYKQGNYEQAISRADQLIVENKDNISSHVVKGWSYLALRKWKDALESGLNGYRIDKRDRRVVQILGEAYYELGNHETALTYLQKYLQIAPDGQLRGWVYYFIGMIYFKKEKYRKADITMSAAVNVDNTKVIWALDLARVQEARNLKARARATYKKVLVQDPNNDVAKKALSRLERRDL